MGPGTKEKYEILGNYLPALSLIMRNQGYEHYLIDACAGSGMVFDPEKNVMVEGSPMILAKTRKIVQSRIKDKAKSQQARCICIEVEDKTYEHLQKSLAQFSEFATAIKGDCNDKLDGVLDNISSDVKVKNHFAFVYIDPFGFGKPTIQRKTIERVLERNFTELLIHFTWEGVSRITGYAMNVDDPNPTVASRARSDAQVLDAYMGEGWRAIEEKNYPPGRRRKEYVDLYTLRLKEYYPLSTFTEIPLGSQNPDYFLFFASRNYSGFEIMNRVIGKMRLKGNMPLQPFTSTKSEQPRLDGPWG